ncbi:MAG: LysR family transcriptional regulator [Acidimicrobiaceae bacterium]|nr:LysR family transcriptional regulator [Acidimicrobiaceae bacterium]
MMIFSGPEPPLHLLRTFEAAARHSNFTRAAHELAVSQPAVSQQIRLLERMLGRVLFERSGPSVRPTEDGRQLATAVADGLARIEHGLGQIRARAHDNCLEVRANSTFVTRWLLPRLPAFLDEHPEVELDLTTSYWAEPPLATGAPVHIDFGPVSEEAELLVGPQTLLAVARPEIASEITGPADLSSATLLEVVGGDGWQHFLSGFDTTLEPWPHTHRSMTYLHMIDLAWMGRGVALIHEMIVEDLIERGELAVVAGMVRPSREHFYLVTPAARRLNPAAAAFLTWLRSFRR